MDNGGVAIKECGDANNGNIHNRDANDTTNVTQDVFEKLNKIRIEIGKYYLGKLQESEPGLIKGIQQLMKGIYVKITKKDDEEERIIKEFEKYANLIFSLMSEEEYEKIKKTYVSWERGEGNLFGIYEVFENIDLSSIKELTDDVYEEIVSLCSSDPEGLYNKVREIKDDEQKLTLALAIAGGYGDVIKSLNRLNRKIEISRKDNDSFSVEIEDLLYWINSAIEGYIRYL